MKKKKTSKFNIVKLILGVMMISSFIFFIWGEMTQPPENSFDKGPVSTYKADWVRIDSDGNNESITVPGECEAERGEWVTIETTLSKEQGDIYFCIRCMQQDMKIYIGDELRKEYSTLDTQLFGKTSTMTYVMFPVYETDAGKTLKIEFMSDSAYSGYVSEILMGDKNDILQNFYKMYAPGAIVAALLLIIGILVVCGSLFVHFIYKKNVDIIHLGNAIIIAASWLLVESKIRQFIFPNSTIAMMMGFLLTAILPYPFLSYINSVQKNRYKKVYMAIGVCTAINYVVVVLLQVLNIKDFFETMTFSHIIIVALIITMGVTTVLDVVRGYVKEYREVAIGIAALMLAGICEIGLVYMVSAQINGISLCIGLIVLLVTAGLKSVRDVINIEKDKQYAIATSESKAKFLANMSHEIRTPINTIIGMNEMILRESDNEAIEEYSHNIKSASEMLLGLINDVLDFSKIEAGKLQIVESNYKLAEVLNDVILGIEMRAKQKNLDFILEVDENMPSVLQGDSIRIKQILNNLLSNAVKYTEKGNVTFYAKGIQNEEGFVLKFAVKDTGIGIKKEDMEHIFSSFQRLELTKNHHVEGTGLGLNITQLLVNLMNGTIDIESEYGNGSTFTVQLPQKIIDSTAMGSLNRKHKPEEVKQGKFLEIPDANILIVDDTKMNLLVLEKLLMRTKAKLDKATGGNECFEMTKIKKYDVILMDHMMPEPDGVETLHMIRNDASNLNVNTPIIVLTANAIVGMKEQYLAEGFADYLSKPIEIEKLEDVLEKFLL